MKNIEIIEKFLPDDDLLEFRQFGNGHINSTFFVRNDKGGEFILQRINSSIFKEVDALMNNIKIVTDFLRERNIETIKVVESVENKNYFQDGDKYYRMYQFIPQTMTFESTEGDDMVENAATAFAWFHRCLNELDGSVLTETIKNFHNTKVRYQDFIKAVEDDKAHRVLFTKNEIDDIKKFEDYYPMIVDAIEAGEVKLHVTHNDPKINNALFDVNTKKFRSIIDLDTVMPGSVLYDFGDALRSLFTSSNEDNPDYEKVVVDTHIYEVYTRAYLEVMKDFLTPKELELLPYAPFILAMELAMRFLGDYFNGDVYFATKRPKHNLDRARTQINLGQSIMKKMPELKKITEDIIKSLWLLKMQKLS